MDVDIHNVSLDLYKNFIFNLRRKEFEHVYILITEDNTEKLKEYVRLVIAVPFEDGDYHTYYGGLKKIISSYVVYFSNLVDDVSIDADKYINDPYKDDLEFLIERTITIHQKNQVDFGKEFLPVTTPKEKEKYEELQKEYDEYMAKLYELRDKIAKIDNQERVVDYVTEQFSKAAKNMSTLFDFTRVYLGRMLAECLEKIRVSLDEIRLRLTNNLNRLTEENEDMLTSLMMELYDKNQANLSVRRRSRKFSMALAEVNLSIQNLKKKIETYQTGPSIIRLEEEVQYWNKRIKDFLEVSDSIKELTTVKKKMQATLDEYNTQKCTELPGTVKAIAWKNIGANLRAKNTLLDKKLLEAVKALMTFFACRGTDRIYYTDNMGVYFVDNFDHQVYVCEDGLGIYHLNCKGEFTDFPDNAYFFDRFGRYFVNEAGEKVYQCDPCTSHYNLGEGDLMNKVTQDCGHSYRINPDCKMEITDPNVFELLPDVPPVDITNTLDTATVRYLWSAFGGVLPAALHDVGTVRPRNPIHFLAHKLLQNKYRRTNAQFAEMQKEAQHHRADINQKRREKAEAESRKWLSKQPKKAKPEEYDDTEARAAHQATLADSLFLHAINYAVNG